MSARLAQLARLRRPPGMIPHRQAQEADRVGKKAPPGLERQSAVFSHGLPRTTLLGAVQVMLGLVYRAKAGLVQNICQAFDLLE